MSHFKTSILSILLLVFVAQSGFAQKRPILDALFKTLMDSQIEREKQQQIEAQRHYEHRHRHGDVKRGKKSGKKIVIEGGPLGEQLGRRPGVPGRQTVITETQVLPAVVTVRTTIDEYVNQCDALAGRLKAKSKVRGARPLLAKCMKLRNNARLLQQKCRQTSDVEYITKAYQQLDAQWRTLSFEIQSVPEIQQECVTYVEQLDNHCDQICDTLAVEPQFDRHRLLQLQSQATAYIETLLDDIEVELHGTPDCDDLLTDGRRLQESIRHQSEFVETASYDEVVQRFSGFVQEWRQYAPRLYPFQNATIQRRLSRIRSCGQDIYAALWMPPAVDREYLGYLSGQTTHEMSQLFDHMTVQALVEMPVEQQRQVLRTARQLHSQCQQYSAGVSEHVSLANLRQRFGGIQEKWAVISPHLDASRSTELRRCENRISSHCEEMSEMLGLVEEVGVNQAIQLAAALEGLSEHLRDDVLRYQGYYQGPLKSNAQKAAKTFHRQCKSLHRELSHQHNPDDLRAHCIEMVESWNALTGVIDAMPKHGLSSTKFQRVSHSRAELYEIVAELAALLVV